MEIWNIIDNDAVVIIDVKLFSIILFLSRYNRKRAIVAIIVFAGKSINTVGLALFQRNIINDFEQLYNFRIDNYPAFVCIQFHQNIGQIQVWPFAPFALLVFFHNAKTGSFKFVSLTVGMVQTHYKEHKNNNYFYFRHYS